MPRRDITATYSLDTDGSIKVDNRCIDGDGKPDQAIGQAVPADASTAKLEVSFLPRYLRWLPFSKGDYWVMRVAPDYTAALVGMPDRAKLSLRCICPAKCEATTCRARGQGFDLATPITPLRSGNAVHDAALARA